MNLWYILAGTQHHFKGKTTADVVFNVEVTLVPAAMELQNICLTNNRTYLIFIENINEVDYKQICKYF
jgi:hypothetical protein